jgi:hypothetical protein
MTNVGVSLAFAAAIFLIEKNQIQQQRKNVAN